MTDRVKDRSSRFTRITFRKGSLDVSDPEEFQAGIVRGQAAMVDSLYVRTDEELFRFFADGVSDCELSKSWNVGFFLGMADALLRGRKEEPPEMRRPPLQRKRTRCKQGAA